MIPVLLGLGMGAGLPVQTAVNARLRKASGSPLFAALVNFSVGSAFLVLALLLTGSLPRLLAAGSASTQWWMWCGAVAGFAFLTTNILLFPELGSVETAIWPVMGQIIMAVAVDAGGWLGATQRPLTAVRCLGALAVVVGVLLAVALKEFHRSSALPRASACSSPGGRAGGARGTARWAWRAVGIAGGACATAQGAINGALGRALDSPISASAVNFVSGAVVLGVLVPIIGAGPRTPGVRRRGPRRMWLGGIIGGTYVFLTSLLVPIIGTGMAMILALVGQVACSIAVDAFGWLGATRSRIAPMQAVGLVVMVVGAVLVRLG